MDRKEERGKSAGEKEYEHASLRVCVPGAWGVRNSGMSGVGWG